MLVVAGIVSIALSSTVKKSNDVAAENLHDTMNLIEPISFTEMKLPFIPQTQPQQVFALNANAGSVVETFHCKLSIPFYRAVPAQLYLHALR